MPLETPAAPGPSQEAYASLGAPLLTEMHRLMVRTRLTEERLIRMIRTGDGFFWIGGPGEEAFNIPLGLLVKKGRGPQFDFLHLHYRSSGILFAMGAPVIDTLRQMRCTATDPYSKGRNFVNHYAYPEWNIPPVSPTIETQYATAIGTGIAQARTGGDGVTIVTGGDAGTAEGDFHSCLVWANRPVLPLPILITVQNNEYGISTERRTQHGEKQISDWAKIFSMPGKTINGNDPVEAYLAVKEALAYCRKERKPYLLEAHVSRLYGHSSSSGSNRMDEADCIALFEEQLLKRGLASKDGLKSAWDLEKKEADEAYEQVKKEPQPDPATLWEGAFAGPLPSSYPIKGGS